MAGKRIVGRAEENSDDTPFAFKDYQKIRKGVDDLQRQEEEDREELERVIEQTSLLAVEAEIAGIELRQIINASIDGIMLVNEDCTVRLVNRALQAFLNKTESEAIGQKCYDLLPDSRCGGGDCPLTAILHGEESLDYDTEKKRGDGALVPFICTATPFRGLEGELVGTVIGLKNIKERKHAETVLKKANEQLERFATVDGLTHLANRRCFDQTISREWGRLRRNREPLSLVLCEVDHFKEYSEACDDGKRDECLRTVGQTLEKQVRRSGDLVARYDNGKFAVILPGTDADGAFHVAEFLRLSIERLEVEHSASSLNPHVTISLGAATAFPTGKTEPKTLVESAGKALRNAKRSGGNNVAFRHVAE